MHDFSPIPERAKKVHIHECVLFLENCTRKYKGPRVEMVARRADWGVKSKGQKMERAEKDRESGTNAQIQMGRNSNIMGRAGVG